ncbi:hypothetical protein H5410_021574 [Solanum commersonii]|uniref:Uncharacterized protein n=1 Tax=Solanum commersonii TaxID=4109 RepID=A0A9J5ZCY9_SOLCO|nr:hypothetical protein H5410_021574 [Solanum commersonii]
MFRKYSNQYKYKDLVLTSDELLVIEMEDLIQKNESLLPDKQDTLSYVHPNEKKLPHTSKLHTEKNANNFTKTEDFQKLSQEASLIRKELKAFEDKVDGQFADMKKFMDASLEELRSFHKVEKENEDVEEPKISMTMESQLVALEAEATHVTPIEQVSKKAPKSMLNHRTLI